tara:strand:+ start:926 stop:1153 length:228 start_codon:yes stop_codon:yes gene_type:complete
MKKISKKDYIAINTRIPVEVYQQMQESLLVTKKTVAAYVADALEQYTELITNTGKNVPETNAMRIDKFAWELSKK